jgi:hypothetical protein
MKKRGTRKQSYKSMMKSSKLEPIVWDVCRINGVQEHGLQFYTGRKESDPPVFLARFHILSNGRVKIEDDDGTHKFDRIIDWCQYIVHKESITRILNFNWRVHLLSVPMQRLINAKKPMDMEVRVVVNTSGKYANDCVRQDLVDTFYAQAEQDE